MKKYKYYLKFWLKFNLVQESYYLILETKIMNFMIEKKIQLNKIMNAKNIDYKMVNKRFFDFINRFKIDWVLLIKI